LTIANQDRDSKDKVLLIEALRKLNSAGSTTAGEGLEKMGIQQT
jgi:hypothetical protein